MAAPEVSSSMHVSPITTKCCVFLPARGGALLFTAIRGF